MFRLDHSFCTRFLQVKMNCIGEEVLVDDIDDRFGHLDSIFSFTKDNKILGMINIGREKLSRQPPRAIER